MCGIIGIYDYSGQGYISNEVLIKMRDSIDYRGPDSSGLLISVGNEIGLGHRRLSVLDLSDRAKQPMCNETAEIWIVFDGEIYNHAELRSELEKKGHIFKTEKSDTEVIIHAYETWGISCVERLRGMFALAIWDGVKKELWLARDRIGIKPLYYTRMGNCFSFASEIKALQVNHWLKKEILEESIYHYLTFLTVPAPNTMFKNIYKLEAGTLLRVNNSGEIFVTRYWDCAGYLNNPLDEDPEIALHRTEELLRDAVWSWSNSDVSCGATLSSGVDSSLIVAMLKERKLDFLTVTMDYEIKSQYSEADIAEKMASDLNINPYNVYKVRSEEFYEGFSSYIKLHTDYPIGAQDIVLFYLLSKYLRKNGIKICMFGEGADELGGYPSYLTMNNEYGMLAVFSKFPYWLKQIVYNLSPSGLRDKIEVATGKNVISRKHIQSFSEWEKKDMWVGKRLESSYLILDRIMSEIRTGSSDEFIRKVLNIEFKLRLPEFMLPRIDYPMLANSIEARVPFLDHILVEYSLRLTNNLKMHDKQAKFLIKKILCSYLGEEYVYRKKIGFGRVLIPLLNCLLPQWFESQVINNTAHPIYSVIKSGFIKDIYEGQLTHGNNGFKIWTLYSLAKWLEVHS